MKQWQIQREAEEVKTRNRIRQETARYQLQIKIHQARVAFEEARGQMEGYATELLRDLLYSPLCKVESMYFLYCQSVVHCAKTIVDLPVGTDLPWWAGKTFKEGWERTGIWNTSEIGRSEFRMGILRTSDIASSEFVRLKSYSACSILSIFEVAAGYLVAWDKIAFMLSKITRIWSQLVEALFSKKCEHSLIWARIWKGAPKFPSFSSSFLYSLIAQDNSVTLKWFETVSPPPVWQIEYEISGCNSGWSVREFSRKVCNLPIRRPGFPQMLPYEVALECNSRQILFYLLDQEVIPRRAKRQDSQKVFQEVYCEVLAKWITDIFCFDIRRLIAEYATSSLEEWRQSYWAVSRASFPEHYLNHHPIFQKC